MKIAVSSEEKIKHLCDVLKVEALAPAKLEAAQILKDAKSEAARLISQAQSEAAEIEHRAREAMHREKEVAESALQQAVSLALTKLRSEIEEKLLVAPLKSALSSALSSPEIVASALESIFKVIASEGVEGQIEATIGEKVDLEALGDLLSLEALKSLGEGVALSSGKKSGLQVKLCDAEITYELNEEILTEMLMRWLRPDFRKRFFKES